MINDAVQGRDAPILDEIQTGEFAEEWIAESESGRPNFSALRQAGRDHPIERWGPSSGDDALDLRRQAAGRGRPAAAEALTR